MELPIAVRKFFGHALNFAQLGDQHVAANALRGLGGAGVLELVEDETGGTYRAVYSVRFEQAVFVFHCFQNKSKTGVTAPKEDMANIRARFKGG